MSEMVEQVAIAMCNHAYLDLKVKRDWDGETRGSKDKWRAMAQAAIEAMREPTVAMMDALDDGDEDGGLENGWRKAIDEALK